MYIVYSLFVCFLCVCTVKDFSGKDKASGAKAGNLPFWGTFFPEAPPEAKYRTNWHAVASIADRRQSSSLTASELGTPSVS